MRQALKRENNFVNNNILQWEFWQGFSRKVCPNKRPMKKITKMWATNPKRERNLHEKPSYLTY